MRKILNSLFVTSALVAAGCGGGGGSAGDNGSGTTQTVASIEVQTDKNTITNAGSDKSLVTIIALDDKRNPVAGAKANVSVSTGIYSANLAETGADGKVTGTISVGENKSNRTITATVAVGGQTRTIPIAVTGSKISFSATPAAPAPGAPVVVAAKVLDVTGAGISGVPVKFSGTLGLTKEVISDINGNATSTLAAAPAAPGIYTVNLEASGVSISNNIQVTLPGNTGIPDAVGVVSSASLSIVPNTISPNAVGSTSSRSGLRAVFQDASNRAIANMRVRFQIEAPGLGAGEQISTGAATVYSNTTGEALSEYIAGTRTSPTAGVVIAACYGFTDASIANGACPNKLTKTMTVANQPLSITLGEDNVIANGNGGLTYIKRYDIAVNDAAGNPVSGAALSASVDIPSYYKGAYSDPLNIITAPRSLIECLNEDTNRNGFLDIGEDINGNGSIEPRKADIIIFFESGAAVTGSNGRSVVLVEWPQNVATWLPFDITVSTSVAGSEGSFKKSFLTSFKEGDEKNGSFLKAPYGSQLNCATVD